jgi:hypothetical protein
MIDDKREIAKSDITRLWARSVFGADSCPLPRDEYRTPRS